MAVQGAHRQRNAAAISAARGEAAKHEQVAARAPCRPIPGAALRVVLCCAARAACHRPLLRPGPAPCPSPARLAPWHCSTWRALAPLPPSPPSQEYQEAISAAATAKGRDKVLLESKASKARSALDAAMDRAASIEAAPLPKVEVGSFEEVLMRMSASEGDELNAWSQVMFVVRRAPRGQRGGRQGVHGARVEHSAAQPGTAQSRGQPSVWSQSGLLGTARCGGAEPDGLLLLPIAHRRLAGCCRRRWRAGTRRRSCRRRQRPRRANEGARVGQRHTVTYPCLAGRGVQGSVGERSHGPSRPTVVGAWLAAAAGAGHCVVGHAGLPAG